LNKITALERTLEVLDRYELQWGDYLTQCILSRILSDHVHRRLNMEHMNAFYLDCLYKDKILDEIERNHIQRRRFNFDHRSKIKEESFLFLVLSIVFRISSTKHR